MEKEVLREWMCRRPDAPAGIRLEQLTDFVLERVFGTAKRRGEGEARNQVREAVLRITRLDLPELYRELFRKQEAPVELERSQEEARQLHEIWEYTKENLESGRLYYDDAIAITYLHLKIYGNHDYRSIRQVVIDEAQDYYPLQFEIFRILFPNAKFTILGDIHQTLARQANLSFYEQIQNILHRKRSSLLILDKSFRCTNEILNFSLQFIRCRPEIRSFNRGGDRPQVKAFDSQKALEEAILKEVQFCRRKGFQTICLLCKTQQNATQLYDCLRSGLDLQLIRDRKVEELKGTFIMPVYMAKGLEFDSVILCDADAENYYDEDDRNLLYVECTRALHRLSVFAKGVLSALIEKADGLIGRCS